MLNKITILVLLSMLAGCAGIRYCAKDESPKVGCRAWDPATRSGGAPRS